MTRAERLEEIRKRRQSAATPNGSHDALVAAMWRDESWLLEEVERLEKALREANNYTNHGTICPATWGKDCDCGYFDMDRQVDAVLGDPS